MTDRDHDDHADERAAVLEQQLADRAADSGRQAVDALSDAVGSFLLAGALKVVRPVAEAVRDQGHSFADLLSDVLRPFQGGEHDEDDEDPRG